MNTQPLVDSLEGQGALIDFSRAELERLVDVCEHRVLTAGETLWGIDEERTACFVLVDGVVERRGQHAGETEVFQYGVPGTFLSISGLVDDTTYHSGAYTLIRSEVLVLRRAVFERLLAAGDPLAFRVIDVLTVYVVDDARRSNERVQEVLGRPAETLRVLRRRIRDDSRA